MVKLIYVIYRRPDISVEEFRRHWSESHASLVRSVQDVLGMGKYVQSLPLPPEVNRQLAAERGIDADLLPDGVAEVWWDSPESMVAGMSGTQGAEVAKKLLEDEERFLDLPRCLAFLTEEEIVVDHGDPAPPG